MATDIGYRFVPDVILCPGETIREVLAERGLTQKDFALKLGRTEKNISQLINGKAPITPETAIELERVLGISSAFWNSAEAAYRDSLAREQEQERLASEVTWARKFPVKDMADNGWIARESTPAEQAAELLRFFGVSTSETWADYWSSPKRLAARMSTAFDTDTAALTAWLRAGEIAALQIDTEPYDASKFKTVLSEIRSATRLDPYEWEPSLIERCASSGVAVVLVHEVPKTRCFAVSWWMSPTKAVIQLCLRYRTDDQFWFSFFHETAHLIKHGKRDPHIHGINADPLLEQEADRWAGDFLIPPAEYSSFISGGRPSKARILSFASHIDIAPGIVVGRLQHDGIIPHGHMNGLKMRLEWAG